LSGCSYFRIITKEILAGEYRKSSFYPLQTFSKSKELEYSKIPFFIEAENEKIRNTF
jgi:hypothetical protein